jgi:hypothetical protein
MEMNVSYLGRGVFVEEVEPLKIMLFMCENGDITTKIYLDFPNIKNLLFYIEEMSRKYAVDQNTGEPNGTEIPTSDSRETD